MNAWGAVFRLRAGANGTLAMAMRCALVGLWAVGAAGGGDGLSTEPQLRSNSVPRRLQHAAGSAWSLLPLGGSLAGDRAALLRFRASGTDGGGPLWAGGTGDGLVGWTAGSADVCTWSAIECAELPGLGRRVVKMEFFAWSQRQAAALRQGNPSADRESVLRNHVSGHLVHIAALDALQALGCKGCHLTGDVAVLASLRNLSHVSLTGVNITGDLGALGALPEMRHIQIAETEIAGSIEPLGRLRKLRLLKFQTRGWGANGHNLYHEDQEFCRLSGSVAALGGMSQLQLVKVTGCQGITGPISTFASCSNLQALLVERTSVSGSMEPLAALPHLSELAVKSTFVSGNANSLRSHTLLGSAWSNFDSCNVECESPAALVPRPDLIAIGSDALASCCYTCTADSQCDGHGHCVRGQCICEDGYKGLYCGHADSSDLLVRAAGGTVALLVLCACLVTYDRRERARDMALLADEFSRSQQLEDEEDEVGRRKVDCPLAAAVKTLEPP